MNLRRNLELPVRIINKDAAKSFCEEHFFTKETQLQLESYKDVNITADLARRSLVFFGNEICKAKNTLNDPDAGIAIMDVPDLYEDPTKNAVSGAMLAVAISQSIMPSVLDKKNLTPFSIFNASKQNSEALDKVGLMHFSPTNLLDFHSDGAIWEKTLSVPKYISLYNIIINYKKPGNFHWVPTTTVPNVNDYVEYFGTGDVYRFDLTPTVYESKGYIPNVTEHHAKTSIFSKQDGKIITFMNGNFRGLYDNCDGIELSKLKEFKSVIADKSIRYSVKQKSRRMIILNNQSGFHARDIFDEPFKGANITRSYLRSVSIDAHIVGKLI